MGSGKTRIGMRLAHLLGYTFVDTDALIEDQQKMKINEIFASHGEDFFRKIESEAISSLQNFSNYVISTGGGAVLNPVNVQNIKNTGKLIYLDAPFEKIIQNLNGAEDRPLIKEKSIEEINALFEMRLPLYKSVADIIVDASGMDTDAIIARLLEQL
ncbi:MAG: shikimate kinase [Clostridiales bacterium]|nr:shikimate kinase [Clostridiales bacterium]